MKKARLFSIGLAIFAMLFGAGNVVFPLGLGRDTGAQVFFAIIGLVITGVMVPLLGLVSASLFNGNYKKFLGMAGRIPGAIIAFVCLVMLGPFGATPRCITLAYASLHWHVPQLSLLVFSIIAVVLIFAATIKKRYVIELLGKILAPIKFTLLLSIVILGLLSTATPAPSSLAPMNAFFNGLREGFWTMDLIGTIFFSGLIIAAIQRSAKEDGTVLSSRDIAWFGLKAGVIGGLLLGLVYTGFCILAAKYSAQVAFVPKDQLLSALASLVLGSKASLLANVTVAVACMTTAIVLTTVFADYLTHELFFGRISYPFALALSVFMIFATTNLGFAGIAHIVEPIVTLCYPALIVLCLANVAYFAWGFRFAQHVTIGSFLITILLHFLPR